MQLGVKHLLDIESLSREQIELILSTAQKFQTASGSAPSRNKSLAGKIVVTAFFEASTRTLMSFEIAAARLGADVMKVSTELSSIVKGETLRDTVMNLDAMGLDGLIIRHAQSGAPHAAAQVVQASVINAGDGAHEHPTQALLDALTILDYRKRLDGLKIVLVGDILHSRVARSNAFLLSKFSSLVVLCGPATLLSRDLESIAPQVTTTTSLSEALEDADVVMGLRLQKERQQQALIPSVRDYSLEYRLTTERFRRAKPDCIVLHPGPLNRGAEMTSEVADGPQSRILSQVSNGVAVRMAVLKLLLGGEDA